MRLKLRNFLARALHWLRDPPPDQSATIAKLNEALVELASRDNPKRDRYMEHVAELVEARAMCGSGPWTVSPAASAAVDQIVYEAHQRYSQKEPAIVSLRESVSAEITEGGAFNIELILQASGWRREVNSSWMEFSRWGIQQIILITRLYYIKNPIMRRLIDVCSAYVFARGVEVSASDETANDVLKDFFERNKSTLGQVALCELEKAMDYDGNIFFVLFPDTQDKGLVNVRTIDATEITEIVTNPQDQSEPWYYKRVWSQREFNMESGQTTAKSATCWYPALNYEPKGEKPKTIGNYPVMWDAPLFHWKVGGVAKWTFGCPRMFPALGWTKESGKYLEACASYAQAVSQLALDFEVKGGQQALMGVKNQMETTVGPATGDIWDRNPPNTQGGSIAHGPGMKVKAFQSRGQGVDPEEVRQFKLMCCMVAGVPETFLGDVSTGNLATATSLDRPTETVFIQKQENWREVLITLCTYVLRVSKGAPSGKLREKKTVAIRECASMIDRTGRRVYAAFSKESTVLELRCNFPAIREGDIPALVSATVEAMAPGTGVGIDEKEGARKLYDLLDIENGDELVEAQYPKGSYEPDRSNRPQEPVDPNKTIRESIRRAVRQIQASPDLHPRVTLGPTSNAN